MKLNQFENIVREVKGEKISKTKVKKKPILIEGDYSFNMDHKLKYDLDIICNDLKQNDDALIIIVAPEGSGKTVMETQIGYYISQKTGTLWGCDNVHFEGQSYMTFSLNNPKYSVVALDESRRALNKMRGMTGNNVDFNNFLSECRSNNQAHIVVLPAYSDLEKYVAIHRVKYLIEIVKRRDKETKKLIRGTFKIISTKSKYKLLQAWKGGYKEFPNNMILHTGTFENVLCLNEKEYEKKKEEAKKERYSNGEDNVQVNDPVKEIALEHYKSGVSKVEIGRKLNKHRNTINLWCKEFDKVLNNAQ